ncbi:MAG: hypothetical protein AB1457_14070 [Chloroflexota bacterium]
MKSWRIVLAVGLIFSGVLGCRLMASDSLPARDFSENAEVLQPTDTPSQGRELPAGELTRTLMHDGRQRSYIS